MSLTYSLESTYYTDPDIFALERKRIFKPTLWLLGPEDVCINACQYMSDTVCGWPVFVIRGKDSVLRGFHNIRPTGNGAAAIQAIGVPIVVNIPSRSSGIGTNSVNVTGPGG